MKSLETLKNEILEDSIIDADEVKEIKELIYADNKIDQEEIDFLFELNDAVSGKNNHLSWKELFVDAVTQFVLEDENSAGSIDSHEAALLLSKIQGDGNIDNVERALLENLKEKAGELPESLAELLK